MIDGVAGAAWDLVARTAAAAAAQTAFSCRGGAYLIPGREVAVLYVNNPCAGETDAIRRRLDEEGIAELASAAAFASYQPGGPTAGCTYALVLSADDCEGCVCDTLANILHEVIGLPKARETADNPERPGSGWPRRLAG
jgi:hypothetical protein